MLRRGRPFASLGAILLFALLFYGGAAGLVGTTPFPHTAQAQTGGNVPGDSLGNTNDSQLWRDIRRGAPGTVSLPNQQGAVMVQSEGENWRALRNGLLSEYGAWALGGIIVLLAVFLALRGRIRTESGLSGRTVQRFNAVERFAHWTVATSFIILALTGLNTLYGRYVILPVLGQDLFAVIAMWGKYAHDYVAFAFMASLVMIVVMWIAENLPNRHDIMWLIRGGGLFVKSSHPSARRFNAGQKIVFWLVVLGGISVSLSGLALLFPFKLFFFAGTFEALNLLGFELPTDLTPLQETQLAQLWHAIVGLGLMVLIVGHIYIGTIGMEGAFDAMGTGEVDENWAKEHHDLWYAEVADTPSEGDD